MGSARPIWLITNDKSGSNDEEALTAIDDCCASSGLRVAHHTIFPARDLPTPAVLDAAGIELVAIFAGDGTLNTAIDKLIGWGGKIIVLPGGTMNLLYHRLHGELETREVIERIASGRCRASRLRIIRSRYGAALAGMLAGPGTSWSRVREAMRESNILEMAEGTVQAIERTLGGAGVACAEPPLGREEGYPLLLLNPSVEGIDVVAFHAESAREYLEQTWALMRRSFREGPHDYLGRADKVVIQSSDGEPFGLLLDGEPAEARPRSEFTLATCEVDLLATEFDG